MIFLKALGALLIASALAYAAADCIFPRIPVMERYIDSLPLMREPASGGRKDNAR